MDLIHHFFLKKFQQIFPDEQTCSEFLFQLRWPSGFKCPKCNYIYCYIITNRQLYECANSRCRYQASVTAGTFMHKTRVPLTKWFDVIYLSIKFYDITKVTAARLSRRINITYPTTRLLKQKIEKAMNDPNSKELLSRIANVRIT